MAQRSNENLSVIARKLSACLDTSTSTENLKNTLYEQSNTKLNGGKSREAHLDTTLLQYTS